MTAFPTKTPGFFSTLVRDFFRIHTCIDPIEEPALELLLLLSHEEEKYKHTISHYLLSF